MRFRKLASTREQGLSIRPFFVGGVLQALGLFLVVLPVAGFEPTWTPTAGPVGGDANTFTVAPNGDFLVGLREGGVYRWSESAATWQPTGLVDLTVLALLTTSRAEILAATTSSTSIFLSDDNGVSWSDYGDGMPGGGSTAFAESPSGDVYAATYYGLFRLAREPLRWNQTSQHLPTNDVAINPEGHIFTSNWNGGVWRSDDDGVTWFPVLQLESNFLTLTTGTDGVVLAGSHHLDYGQHGSEWGWVFLSTDFGVTWEELQLGFTSFGIGTLLVAASGEYLAGTYGQETFLPQGGLFYGTQSGPWNESGLDNVNIFALAETTDSRIWAAGVGSIFRADAIDDAQWSRLNSGLSFTSVWVLDAGSSGIFAGGYGFGVQVSTDNGSSWWQTEISDDYVRSLLVVDDGTAFAIGEQTGFVRSRDGGESWQRAGNPGDLGGVQTPLYLVETADGAICGARPSEVTCSWNRGTSWATHPLPNGAYCLALAAHPEGPLFVGAYLFEDSGLVGQVLRFDPGAKTWSVVLSAELPVFSLTVGRAGLIAAGTSCYYMGCGGHSPRVLLSTDLGSTWQPSAYQGGTVRDMVTDEVGNLYVATSSGIQVSPNHGASFRDFSGLEGIWINGLISHQGQLFAATSSGVWRCDLGLAQPRRPIGRCPNR